MSTTHMTQRTKTSTVPDNNNWNKVIWITVYHDSNKLQ